MATGVWQGVAPSNGATVTDVRKTLGATTGLPRKLQMPALAPHFQGLGVAAGLTSKLQTPALVPHFQGLGVAAGLTSKLQTAALVPRFQGLGVTAGLTSKLQTAALVPRFQGLGVTAGLTSKLQTAALAPRFQGLGKLAGAIDTRVLGDVGKLAGALDTRVLGDVGKLAGVIDPRVLGDVGKLAGAIETPVFQPLAGGSRAFGPVRHTQRSSVPVAREASTHSLVLPCEQTDPWGPWSGGVDVGVPWRTVVRECRAMLSGWSPVPKRVLPWALVVLTFGTYFLEVLVPSWAEAVARLLGLR